MRTCKKFRTVLLTLALVFSLSLSAFAAIEDTGFSDVAATDWYADAAVYCRENQLLDGAEDTEFAPDGVITRAALAQSLYQMAGNPQTEVSGTFTDIPQQAPYTDAVSWTAENGIISGYGNHLFGPDDPVTREQLAAIFWRYAGSPQVETQADFSDESQISPWANAAVDWAYANGYMNTMEDNRFLPADSATRAQAAFLLMSLSQTGQAQTDEETEPEETEPAQSGQTLIAYFSCTGNTQAIAGHLEQILHADLYEIVPAVPYTAEDLDYGNTASRTSLEMNDSASRPAISGGVENMDQYDVIFLGYPIWWSEAPRIINTFLESYDFSGKTIIPFCTSGSSGIDSSVRHLQTLAEDAVWMEGQRFQGGASQQDVESWVNSLPLRENTQA